MRPLVTICAVVALLLAQSARSTPVSAAQGYPVSYHSFGLSSGDGTTIKGGGLTLSGHGLTTTTYTDPFLGTTASYEFGSWTSPEWSTGFGFTELVSSWIAQTPARTFIRVYMRADRGDGRCHVLRL